MCQEFQINTYMTGNQQLKQAIKLANGNILVIWESIREDKSLEGIFGQELSSAGARIGSEFSLIKTHQALSYFHKLAALFDGGFVATWNEGPDNSLFFQIFDSGRRHGPKYRVTLYPAYPQMTGLSNGNFVLCWQSESGILGQLFDKFGNQVDEQFQLKSLGPATSLEDEKFLLHWTRYVLKNRGFEVFGQIFEADGQAASDSFQVNTFTIYGSSYANATAVKNGRFIVIWVSYNTDGIVNAVNGIFGQIFDTTGQKIGPEFAIITDTESNQKFPVVESLENGGFVACWQSNEQDGEDWRVSAQIFDHRGNKVWRKFRVNSNPIRPGYRIFVTPTEQGGFFVSWVSEDSDGTGIFGKFLDTPEALNLDNFSLLEPPNNARLLIQNLTMTWEHPNSDFQCLPGEIRFDLYLDTDSLFTNPTIYPDIEETTFTTTRLSLDKQYFWKVLAKNQDGENLWAQEKYWTFFLDDPKNTADIVVPRDYPTIQTAIENAQDGDTIFVDSGKYFEAVLIDRPIVLIGRDKDSTQIALTYESESIPTVRINAHDVILKNIRIYGRTGTVNPPYYFTPLNGIVALKIASSFDIKLEHLIVYGGSGGGFTEESGKDGAVGLLIQNSSNINIDYTIIQGGNGGRGGGRQFAPMPSGNGGTGAFLNNASNIYFRHSTIRGGNGVPYEADGAQVSAFGHGIHAIRNSSVILSETDASGGGYPGEGGLPYLFDETSTIDDRNGEIEEERREQITPESYILTQNYPNPFNLSTKINFDLPEDVISLTLKIYNINGKEVRALLDGETRVAGFYWIFWDGNDDFGRNVASGVYFYRIMAKGEKRFYLMDRKMLLIK